MSRSRLHQAELHLLVPGLCGPLADTRLLEADEYLDNWLKILARAVESESKNNANEVIADIIGLQFETDFPSAVLTAVTEEHYEKSLSYMLADPVHLRAEMDHAVLTSSEDMAINRGDSDALLQALNNHFEQDGLHYTAIDENHWLISSKDKIELSTTPLFDAIGRNVNFILPQGVDKKFWRQSLNEAQMLMFIHEVNQQREDKGLLSINSVWFHGCGELPVYPDDKQNDSDYRLCGDQPVIKGLATHMGKYTACEYLQQPDTVEGYKKVLQEELKTQKTVNILYLDELESLVNYTDVRPWLDQLEKTLMDWVYPLISYSNQNNIKLKLYPCNSRQYQFSKYDALKFWRYGLKNKLHKYIDSYNSSPAAGR